MSPRKTYILKLYVAGNTPNSMRALKRLFSVVTTRNFPVLPHLVRCGSWADGLLTVTGILIA